MSISRDRTPAASFASPTTVPKLPPPLRETRWIRFKAFLRGILLYNTVYWRRASDAVDRSASRVSRVERERIRPQVDPDVLRPRAQPRPRSLGRGGIILPPAAVEPDEPPSPVPTGTPAAPSPPSPEPEPPAPPPETERRRRRVLRRKQSHAGVDPTRVFSAIRNAPDATGSRTGWLKRLFGRGKDS